MTSFSCPGHLFDLYVEHLLQPFSIPAQGFADFFNAKLWKVSLTHNKTIFQAAAKFITSHQSLNSNEWPLTSNKTKLCICISWVTWLLGSWEVSRRIQEFFMSAMLYNSSIELSNYRTDWRPTYYGEGSTLTEFRNENVTLRQQIDQEDDPRQDALTSQRLSFSSSNLSNPNNAKWHREVAKQTRFCEDSFRQSQTENWTSTGLANNEERTSHNGLPHRCNNFAVGATWFMTTLTMWKCTYSLDGLSRNIKKYMRYTSNKIYLFQ